MSPSLPPIAGSILLKDSEATLDESVAVVCIASIEVILFAGALASTPPPTKYLTVSVVLEGAKPYDLLKRKFDGS